MPLTIHQFPCLSDNYGFLVRDEASGAVACVDTPDGAAIVREADALGWSVDTILNTHWHPDHAGGNAAVKARFGSEIVAPAEVARTSTIDRVVADGDRVRIGETCFDVLATGGHTLGHVCYHAAADGVTFVGDTLFPMGCGRLFEGTPEQMWTSLSRLAALPGETRVYAAHEYTLGNARFALTVDDAPEVRARLAEVEAARAQGLATVPTTIARETATNPFLRAPRLRPGLAQDGAAAAFAAIRRAKDAFKG